MVATTAEEMLQEQHEQTTSATFNRAEVVSLCKKSLDFIASLLMPLQFTLMFPPLHKVVWEFLQKKVYESEQPSPTPTQKFPKIAIGWPRGHAKTTLVKLFVVFCIFFTKKKFILIVASNSTKAENILADICDMLSETNVLNLFGDWRLAIDTERTNLKKFTFNGRDVILAALGSGGDPRGLNLKNERPDMIIMDDMQSKENAESVTQSKTLLSWMTSTLQKAQSPHGCIHIYIGNMFSCPGCILKLLKSNPNWTSVIVAGLLADGTSLWPELRSKEELLQELSEDIAMGTPEAFFSEIMNDPDAGITSCFDISKVPPVPFHQDEIPFGSFIIIDVATDKIGADDTTIIHYSVFEGMKAVADEMIVGSLSPSDTIKRSLEMAIRRGCPAVLVESVAYQSSLLHWFSVVCEQAGIEGIHFLELFPKGRTKVSRILTMFKSLIGSQVSGKDGVPDLYLHATLRPQVFYQISQFKPHKKDNIDDILDNLAYVSDVLQDYSMLIIHPLSPESIAFNEAEVVEYNSPA